MSDEPKKAVTEKRKFCTIDERTLLVISGGVPVSDALELASTLLGGATRLFINGSDFPEDNAVTQHLLDTSKALMDACLTGIWTLERGDFPARS